MVFIYLVYADDEVTTEKNEGKMLMLLVVTMVLLLPYVTSVTFLFTHVTSVTLISET